MFYHGLQTLQLVLLVWVKDLKSLLQEYFQYINTLLIYFDIYLSICYIVVTSQASFGSALSQSQLRPYLTNHSLQTWHFIENRWTDILRFSPRSQVAKIFTKLTVLHWPFLNCKSTCFLNTKTCCWPTEAPKQPGCSAYTDGSEDFGANVTTAVAP